MGAVEAITAILVASPVELLALLNATGTIHLALQPVESTIVPTQGVALNDVMQHLVPGETLDE